MTTDDFYRSDAITRFAAMDTAEQVKVLRRASALDTPAGDILMGSLAGMYPDRYAALMTAIERLEVAA